MALYKGTQKISPIITVGTPPILTTKNVTSNGTYNASSDSADGYSSVTVNVPSGIPREVVNGVYQAPATSFTFSLPDNATDVGAYALSNAFYGCTGLTSVDLSSLTTVGTFGLNYAFYGCTGLTDVDLSSLTIISGGYGMYYAFRGCTGLTEVDLSSLSTISSNIYGMSYAFQGCTSLTDVDLSSLTTISSNYGMRYAFGSCESLTTLSFPSLTSTSFGSYTNQFNDMLSGVTGCTVHFPSNLQSVIGSWASVTAGFGGTNTTILFDLTATT